MRAPVIPVVGSSNHAGSIGWPYISSNQNPPTRTWMTRLSAYIVIKSQRTPSGATGASDLTIRAATRPQIFGPLSTLRRHVKLF